jgi:hypothetical protein
LGIVPVQTGAEATITGVVLLEPAQLGVRAPAVRLQPASDSATAGRITGFLAAEVVAEFPTGHEGRHARGSSAAMDGTVAKTSSTRAQRIVIPACLPVDRVVLCWISGGDRRQAVDARPTSIAAGG